MVSGGILIVIVVAAVAIAAMLFVRRGEAEGSRFTDGDRASRVFSVLATGFALLAGFVVFLAFENFDTARAGAGARRHRGAPVRDRAVPAVTGAGATAIIEAMNRVAMAEYARVGGWALARSGDAVAIASYLGSGDSFDRAMASFDRDLRRPERRRPRRAPARGRHRQDRRRNRTVGRPAGGFDRGCRATIPQAKHGDRDPRRLPAQRASLVGSIG
jgi:hypothetical protein